MEAMPTCDIDLLPTDFHIVFLVEFSIKNNNVLNHEVQQIIQNSQLKFKSIFISQIHIHR